MNICMSTSLIETEFLLISLILFYLLGLSVLLITTPDSKYYYLLILSLKNGGGEILIEFLNVIFKSF